jgi:hypothetical protein
MNKGRRLNSLKLWSAITGVALVVALVLTFLPMQVSIDTDGFLSISLRQTSSSPDTLTVRPNAVGDESNCAVSGDTPGWKCVDEAVADDDSTYVFCYSGTSPRDLYNLADVDLAGTINYVRVYVRVRRTTTAPNLRVRTVIKLDEVVVEGSDISIITSYANYYTDYATKPGGGTWTWTDINNLQAGVHLNVYSVLYLARCTQVYVEVDYTPVSIVAPTVTTQAATDVLSTSCTGNGNITATGGENCTTRGFCYMVGISGDPTTANSTAYDTGSYGTSTYAKSITGLTPSTGYRVRAYAINSAGTGYGDTVQVTTSDYIGAGISPTSYNFTIVATTSTPYTTTSYFTLTNNSSVQTDQTISVTTSTWSGGIGWTHSDNCTADADTAGLKANVGGTWGIGDIIVKYSSPDYIYDNCPAYTNYNFGLKLWAPTSISDGIEKSIIVRITIVAS